MYLSGGPGGAGVVEMIDVLLELPPLARRFTVLGFDQRGTGRSGLLRCREIERDERLRSTRAGERCAQRLGAKRSFYTTPDSVEDMEALRRAAGAPKLTLMGISYGTELALAYARRYPDRVERLILDSVVDPDDGDPFGLAGFRAMGPTLRALCPDGCRGVTTDPVADLVALTARLRAAPLRGVRYDGRGRRHRGAVTPVQIADLLYDADYNPALRAGVPVAVRAALAGDAAPLLRLHRALAGLPVGAARLLRGPLRGGLRGDAAAVAARDAARPALRRGQGGRARAAGRGVLAVRRRGRLRRRDRSLPALARSRAPAGAEGRRLSGGPGAAAAGRGGPPHAPGGVRAHRGR